MSKEAYTLSESEWPAEAIRDHFLHPRNIGDVELPAHSGCAASLSCGAAVRISLKVDQRQRISEVRFKATGCSVLVAAASILTEDVRGKTTGQAAARWQAGSGARGIISKFGSEAAGNEDCALLACEALLAGIKRFSDIVRDEWTGDEALVCTCFGVSEKTIENLVHRGCFQRVEEVTRACNAGAGCRSCWPLIQDILDQPNLAKPSNARP
ncbi:MAG TPA: iron-sulfur cluster assembly scaffold protein [Pyrinomonadaceae bacterium]|nr:iron-sulfur cluster assembly scaffold protein [Pyrinomonadaceae bacterium]